MYKCEIFLILEHIICEIYRDIIVKKIKLIFKSKINFKIF